MNLVHRRSRTMRAQFRKLPRGAEYWLASSLVVAPDTKVGEHARVTGITTGPNGALTTTAVSDATVATVRMPRYQSIQR